MHTGSATAVSTSEASSARTPPMLEGNRSKKNPGDIPLTFSLD